QAEHAPEHAPATEHAGPNLPMAVLSQAASFSVSGFAAFVAWHVRSQASLLPSAFSFAPMHMSARAGAAPTATRATAAMMGSRRARRPRAVSIVVLLCPRPCCKRTLL